MSINFWIRLKIAQLECDRQYYVGVDIFYYISIGDEWTDTLNGAINAFRLAVIDLKIEIYKVFV